MSVIPKTIKITIPLKGISKGERKVQFETDGFVGAGCQAATAAFERAVGAVENEELKQEYFETEQRHEFLSGQ